MKIRYSAIAEMQEAPHHIKQQFQDIQEWVMQLQKRLYACEHALEHDIISLNDVPDKISEFRASLYEIDKSLEILSMNCSSLTQTQNKEDNDEAGNRNQHESTSPVPDGQGSES